jgi:hypothetical protein
MAKKSEPSPQECARILQENLLKWKHSSTLEALIKMASCMKTHGKKIENQVAGGKKLVADAKAILGDHDNQKLLGSARKGKKNRKRANKQRAGDYVVDPAEQRAQLAAMREAAQNGGGNPTEEGEEEPSLKTATRCNFFPDAFLPSEIRKNTASLTQA